MDSLNSSDESCQCGFSNGDKCPTPRQGVNMAGLGRGGGAVVQERKQALCTTPGNINIPDVLVKSGCTMPLPLGLGLCAFFRCLPGGQFSGSASLKMLQACLLLIPGVLSWTINEALLPHPWSSSTPLLEPPQSLSPL